MVIRFFHKCGHITSGNFLVLPVLSTHSHTYMAENLKILNNTFDRMKTSTVFWVGPTCFLMIIQSTLKPPIMNPFTCQRHQCFGCRLFSHNVSLLSNLLAVYKTNKLVDMKHFTGTRIEFLCNTHCRAWDHIAKQLDIQLVSTIIPPYMYYNYPKSKFVPISSRLPGFFRLTENGSFTEDFDRFIKPNLICPVACNRRKQEDQPTDTSQQLSQQHCEKFSLMFQCTNLISICKKPD